MAERDDWQLLSVRDVCVTTTSGGTPSRKHPEYFVHRGIPWLKTQELSDSILYDALEHISEVAVTESSAKLLPVGTVLVAMYGATAGQLGLLGKPMACNQACCALVVDEAKADPRFLYYALLNDRLLLRSLANGAAQQNLNVGIINTFPILAPPLSEQRAIAEVLGALDDKIEANRRQVQCLLNLIRADWHLRFCEGKDQWPELPIGEVCGVVGGSTPRTTVQEYWDGNIAWATPKDLSRLSSPPLLDTERRITELGLRQISSGLLPRGTVLLSSRAPIGYLAIAELPVAVNQGFIALVPSERLPGLYLWQWLANNLDEITTRANGTTFLEVSKANFRPMPVPIPPEEELAVWFKVAEPMYQLIVTKEVENGKLIEVRDTLLPKLLSGELRVRDAESLVETTL